MRIVPILVVVLSFGMLLLYIITDEIYLAVTAIWILLLWIFVNGVKEWQRLNWFDIGYIMNAWLLEPTQFAYLFIPTELVVMRKSVRVPKPPQAANSVGISLLTQLHIEPPAVCRLPKQDDKGGANPRTNPANAMATWTVGMQECGTAITH